MRAVLLCAGRGSRLDPLTALTPKCLVPVGGRAILDHQLDALHANGINAVTVVGGYRHEAIAAHLDKLSAAARPDLLLNPFWSISSSIGSIWTARAALDGPFVIINGDTVFDGCLIAEALAGLRAGINLVIERPSEPESDDMRVIVADGQVRDVGKHLDPAAAPYRSLGIVICPDADGGPYQPALDAAIFAPLGLQSYHHDIVAAIAADQTVWPILASPHLWGEIDRVSDIDRLERRLSA